MSTTDTRPGFRLPWSAERAPQDAAEPGPAGQSEVPDPPGEAGVTAVEGTSPAELPVASRMPTAWPTADLRATARDEGGARRAALTPDAASVAAEGALPAAHRRPTKFLADLTAAMRTAAEAAREQAISQFQADTKAVIGAIHEASGEEAAGLRTGADQDVASVREWSKAEIARIREETDAKIAQRRQALERELEMHAADVERRVESVHEAVAAYEREMAAFFERLLAETDPARFASMAETMPEPPVLTDPAGDVWPNGPADDPGSAPGPAIEDALADDPDSAASLGTAPDPSVATALDGEPGDVPGDVPGDDPQPADGDEEALSVRGDEAGLDAAEAEAALAARLDAGSADEDVFVQRLAGLPDGGAPATDERDAEPVTSRVVVTGLVSVASIASFKRHLGRVAGVHAVAVSSGPDGEFVFVANHRPDISVRDIVPALPGFGARVTHASEGVVTVTAHDPESDV